MYRVNQFVKFWDFAFHVSKGDSERHVSAPSKTTTSPLINTLFTGSAEHVLQKLKQHPNNGKQPMNTCKLKS